MPTLDTTARKPKPAHVPAYRRIAADLRSQIERGTWAVGVMIPGRRELAKQFGVDLNTVQNAIRLLLDDGTLHAEGGRGTFVARSTSNNLPNVDTALVGTLPAAPMRGSIGQASVTVGIIAALWEYTDTVREPHDNWPAAILHSFECGMALLPNATVKFIDAAPHGTKAKDECYFECLRHMIAEGINALVLITPPLIVMRHVEQIVAKTRLPVVVIAEDYTPSRAFPMVSFDNEYSGFLAAEHLLQRGYTTISVFCPYVDSDYTVTRRRGVDLALERVGKAIWRTNADTIRYPIDHEHNYQRSVARLAARQLLLDRPDGWGIVAINDHAGHGLIDAASEMGLLAGRDFGVIGFDDLSESRILNMSSLHPPLDAMGIEATKMLLNRMESTLTLTEARLRSNLVARSSTQPTPSPNTVRLDIGIYDELA